ncbi:MAG: HAD family phosphatase [Phycisphaeraceae bacterium]|nr:MAG: HAD family phosphatase [Phycisphaeraceae bacterium]
MPESLRNYDAVVCDIDGCLGPEQNGPLDADALAAVAAYNRLAHDKGDRPVVTVCTGRPLPYAEAMARLIGTDTLPVVCEMGVWLWHADTNIFDCDPRITPQHVHIVHEAQEWIEATWGASNPRGPVQQQPGKACSISLHHPDTPYLKGLEPLLRDEFARRNWPFRVSSTWEWINIDLAHISKATGIERLMAHTGLTKARLAGIGDTIGDLAIREHVAFFACPANADDRLKAHADFVADDAEIHGVLDILDRLIAT